MLLARGQPLLETLLLTLLLPVEGFGQWAWATALYIGVLSFTNGGIPAAMLRYSALEQARSDSLLQYALQKSLLWASAGMLALGGLAWTVPVPVRYWVWAHLPAVPAFLAAEVLRAYLRSRYENARLLRWQALSVGMGLFLLVASTSQLGIEGAALTRLLQPVWLLAPIAGTLASACRAAKQPFPGFVRFGLHALWGNLALEALFFLPAWLIGWSTRSATLLAYWRWATLLPLNLRALFAQAVMYFYPKWVQAPHPLRLYRSVRGRLWLAATGLALLLVGVGFFWRVFPGPTYLAARPYYWGAIGVGWLWSTEALLLPNLLSAQGYIRAYSWAYGVGLLSALPWYFWAGDTLSVYLMGLGMAALTAAFTAALALRRLAKSFCA